ncbi:N(4)-acetylcytidine aminohydrolase [Gilliamella sp. Lep-s21]|uniref:N(4)-acetylcytidine aminohydrolase n=1 Tax=unclassified Gilliamella TaxID=2685620 RepID=UPI00130AAC76|nr:ASCH domain-containing protein [Gilliamella sp. Lep-s35]MWP68176.1 ASCH domain-containing protein [Gilliamella sp. Lep-s5]MWP76396.1 ASCH domain-containing protein [Gilliamella sp. Lep-s21]
MQNDITFYQRFKSDILSGLKVITIRDRSESHFKVGDKLRVGTFETDEYFCTIKIISVTPITLEQLTEEHAKQENMTLSDLKKVISDIYPNEIHFFVIHFSLL